MHRILLVLGLAGVAFAQTGQITGLVSDPAGTSVPGAKVAVTNIDTGIKRETRTNDQGYYTFALLNPGNYELTVQKTGFRGMTRPGIKLDVVAYGCTSGTVVIGEEKVFARIREARPGVACTTPITAGIAGLQKLGATRIALLTPYVDEVNRMFRGFIEERGIAVPVMGSFNHGNDNEVARISQGSIKDAVRALAREPGVDGVFVSCTSLRVADIAEELEAELGKPVTSSNHALAWHCLRLAGVNDSLPGLGRLFRV